MNKFITGAVKKEEQEIQSIDARLLFRETHA